MIVQKAWGTELWIVNDVYCGKILTLKQGWQSSLHMHPIKDETFYVASGLVAFEMDGIHQILGPGETVRIYPGRWHRFGGIMESVIYEFSTRHDDADVVRREFSREMT